jgi:hypothetical protein
MKDQTRLVTALISALALVVGLRASAQRRANQQMASVTSDSQPIPDELKLAGAPKTARKVACFCSVKEGFTMFDVVWLCGIPDEQHGSGIYIFLYRMDDGSIVTIGTPNLDQRIMGVRYLKSGRSVSLLHKAPEGDSLVVPQDCIGCPNIVVRGRLARILTISGCKGISGMTCRIEIKQGAALPSRILVRQCDQRGRLLGKKYLPYPNLKPGERGSASFPIGAATSVVLVGEWKGEWQSAY